MLRAYLRRRALKLASCALPTSDYLFMYRYPGSSTAAFIILLDGAVGAAMCVQAGLLA